MTINTFKNKYLQWYPSLVEDDLMVGRADQAANPNVVYDMRVSHIVNLLDLSQLKVFSHISYLLVPLAESEDQELLSVLPRSVTVLVDGEVCSVYCRGGSRCCSCCS